MSSRIRYNDWALQTRRLASRQPGQLRAEAECPSVLFVTVERPADGRQFTTEISTDDAARELIAGLHIAFPHLMGGGS